MVSGQLVSRTSECSYFHFFNAAAKKYDYPATVFFFLQAAKLLNYVGAADGKNLLSMFVRYSPIAVVSARRRFLTDVTLWGAANVRDSSTAFLSASLYVSKRGAD